MNTLLLATRSPDKVREIKEILAGEGVTTTIMSLDDARVAWSSKEDAIEEFDSFQANARAKAEYFAKLTGLPTVADDSGLEVLSLMGEPGVRSRRFSPDGANLAGKAQDEANNRELLRRLSGAEEKRRRASYTAVAVLLRRPRRRTRPTPAAAGAASWRSRVAPAGLAMTRCSSTRSRARRSPRWRRGRSTRSATGGKPSARWRRL